MDWEMITETALKWVVPVTLGGLAGWIAICAGKIAALVAGVQCLLRAEIIRSHEKYVEKGFCPIYAKEALKKEYSAYEKLHGNDVGEKLYKDMIALPEDEKKEGENSGCKTGN